MSAITIQLKFEFVQDKQQKLLRCSAYHVDEMLIATHSRKVLTRVRFAIRVFLVNFLKMHSGESQTNVTSVIMLTRVGFTIVTHE